MYNGLKVIGVFVLFLSSICHSEFVYGQSTITGTVMAEGESLPGVAVMIKGETRGTVTDSDGNYVVESVPKGTVLVFAFLGYATQQVIVNNQSVINVNMEADISSLQDIVFVGYGTVQKSDLTGSVSSLKEEDMNQIAVTNVEQALLGRVPGVQIRQSSAEPGGGMSVKIRGISSIAASSSPLYVIDGLPINNEPLNGGSITGLPTNDNPKNPLASINTHDIASVEILKDASATAIYGSRGANGVVLITTKKGTEGKMKIGVNSYAGVQTILRHADVLSTEEYIATQNELWQARSDAGLLTPGQAMNPPFTDEEISNITGTDWLEEVVRDAAITSTNISISGGDLNTRYFISGNYMSQDGIIRKTGFERYSARVNLQSELGDKVDIGLNLTNSLLQNRNATEGTSANQTGIYYSAFGYDPTLPLRDDEGNFSNAPNLNFPNPLNTLEARDVETETTRLLGSIFLNFNITDQLSTKIKYGLDRSIGRRDFFARVGVTDDINPRGVANLQTQERYSSLFEYTVTYDNQFSHNFGVNAVAGVTYETFTNRDFNVGARDFITDAFGTDAIGSGDNEQLTAGSFQGKNQLLSYLFRSNFNLFSKLLLTTSVRVDGSSKFAEGNKYGVFPSVAVAYKLHNEDFVPELVNELKLRVSHGATGNQSVASYSTVPLFTTGAQTVLGGSPTQGFRYLRRANPELTWETSIQTNFGIDLGLFGNRITATMDYFITNTEDLLFNEPLPRSLGFDQVLQNVGSLRNHGFELAISTVNLQKEDFSWNTRMQVSFIRNEVTKLGRNEQIAVGNLPGTFAVVQVGQPLNSYFMQRVDGFFQTQEEIDNSAQPTATLGSPKVFDANGDDVINQDDRVIVGSPYPDYTFGIGNSITYKNFTLDFFIDGSQGAELYNGNLFESLFPDQTARNVYADVVLDRWTPNNTDAEFPNFLDPTSAGYGGVSLTNSLSVEDASFIRLQNVNLSYDVPTDNFNFINDLTFYVSAQNLFIITDYRGLNPDANRNGASPLVSDINAYPMARTYIAGLNITF